MRKSYNARVLSNTPKKQKGLALIMVMFIVSMVVVMATALIKRQSIDIKRTGNILSLAQAEHYAMTVEALITGPGGFLDQDYLGTVKFGNLDGSDLDADNKPVDHFGELWAFQQNPAIPPEFPLKSIGLPLDFKASSDPKFDFLSYSGPLAKIWIFDLQGRFNVNNLSTDVEPAVRDKARARFRRILTSLGDDELNPEEVETNLVEWFDKDSGADNEYNGLDIPYRAGYQQMNSISELMLVKGIDLKVYKKLKPYIAALPVTDAQQQTGTPINVNTAPDLVLRALHPNFSKADVDEINQERTTNLQEGKKFFAKVDDFMQVGPVASANGQKGRPNGRDEDGNRAGNGGNNNNRQNNNNNNGGGNNAGNANGILANELVVYSEYFEVYAKVFVGEYTSRLQAVVRRDYETGQLVVISRDLSQSEPNKLPESDPIDL